MMMARFLVAPLLLALALPAAARQDAADLKVFDEVWRLVDRNFYDRDFHGVDWPAMRDKYRPDAEKAKTRPELHAVINRMLGELKASHVALVEGEVYRDYIAPEMTGRSTLRSGFELTRLDGGYFVTGVYEGGPAETAGVRTGDRLLSIDGEEPDRSPDLLDAGSDPGIPGPPHFVVRVRDGERLDLRLERRRGEEAIEVRVEPAETSMVEATRRSVRVVEARGKRIGVIHLWHYLSGGITRALKSAIEDDFAECDAIALDIRGRGGSPIVMNQVMSLARKWTKPIVCLIDEGSRSAKEVFAHQWKDRKVGPLVGVKTPGAVLGSTFFKVSDGSWLLLAVANVDRLAGVRLEGVGVEPDVAVVRDVRWSAGHDPILAKGIDVLLEKLGAPRPDW